MGPAVRGAQCTLFIPSTGEIGMKIKSNVRAGKGGSSINNTVVSYNYSILISRCVGI